MGDPNVDGCPCSMHWGIGPDTFTDCQKPAHLPADPHHEGLADNGVTVVRWSAGDRREFTGEYPGPCPRQPCSLPAGHRGDHSP